MELFKEAQRDGEVWSEDGFWYCEEHVKTRATSITRGKNISIARSEG